MESRYDVVIAGGGLAGSALGRSLAMNGIQTLILERERQFKDRVRGEQMQPWGVGEAERLGILDLLRQTCGHDQGYFDISLGGMSFGHRDLRATTPQAEPCLNFYHPAMQEALLGAAESAGAEIRRGAVVRELRTNGNVRVTVEDSGKTEGVRARLVVGADGRSSTIRKEAAFDSKRDPSFLMVGGVLADELQIDMNTAFVYINPMISQCTAIFPQGGGRARIYAIYPVDAGFRLQGERDIPRFEDETLKAGAPADLYSSVRFSGPLASFDAADTWVDHPYRDGIALIGDAAAANDPAWGQGLSLSLRDARVLAEALLSTNDWNEAGHSYAREHDRHYGVIHDVTRAMTEMFIRSGPEADARRARALPQFGEDPTRVPDHVFSGPDLPWNNAMRRRFYGED